MVETQLCKLRDTSDTFVGRAYSTFYLQQCVCEQNLRYSEKRVSTKCAWKYAREKKCMVPGYLFLTTICIQVSTKNQRDICCISQAGFPRDTQGLHSCRSSITVDTTKGTWHMCVGQRVGLASLAACARRVLDMCASDVDVLQHFLEEISHIPTYPTVPAIRKEKRLPVVSAAGC